MNYFNVLKRLFNFFSNFCRKLSHYSLFVPGNRGPLFPPSAPLPIVTIGKWSINITPYGHYQTDVCVVENKPKNYWASLLP